MVNHYHPGGSQFCLPMIEQRLWTHRRQNYPATPQTSFLNDHTRYILIKLSCYTFQAGELWYARNAGIHSPPSNGKRYWALFALVVVGPTGMFSCPDVQLMTQVTRNTRHLGFVTWSNRPHLLRTPLRCMMLCGT